MTVRDTSLEAFKRLDLTAGQRRVLNWLAEQPAGATFTRQEIADQSRIPIQSVCGRVHELLHDFQDPPLEELPARDGAHPVRLKIARQTAEESRGSVTQGGGIGNPQSAAARGPKPEGNPAVGPAPAADPIGVMPVLEGRMSMTAAQAKAVVEHPGADLIPEWCMSEAREVIARGEFWRAP